jgi:hypothetical protein
LLRRIAAGDARVEFKKLASSQASAYYGRNELWEAKVNRKYRLFIASTKRPVEILGFGHRGENGVFRKE